MNDLPVSEHTIRCIVNMDQHALKHLDKWVGVPLITDLSMKLEQEFPDPIASPSLHYAELRSIAPHAGRYISGGRMDRVKRQSPEATIDFARIPAIWMIGETNRFRLDGVGVAEDLAGCIESSVRDNDVPIVFLDNMVHPSTGGTEIAWFHTCRFLRMLRDKLNSQRQVLIANVAVAPWIMSELDAKMLSDSVDGMAFEMAFHENIRDRPDRIEKELARHRAWLDAGKTVICIPLAKKDDPAHLESEAAYMAEQVHANRKTGDSWWVAYPYFKEKPDWAEVERD